MTRSGLSKTTQHALPSVTSRQEYLTVNLYNEGALHSPRREGDTRLIRVEGVSMAGVKRDKYEVAA